MNTKKTKVIVTGASGQTGSLMIDFLLKNTDFEVIGTVRRTSQIISSNFSHNLPNSRFKIIHLDLNDPHSITSVIKNEKPDFFFNFGASAFVPDSWDSPAMTIQTNTVAVIHILEAIRSYVPFCKFYNACSSEIFGDVLETPQKETTRPNPRSIYGVSKNASREIVEVYRRSYGLFAVNGILFNQESPRRQKHYVTRKITSQVAKIKRALENKELFEPLEIGNLEAKRDWSSASCFVEAIFLMMSQKEPKDYILSSNETHSVREFIELAFKAAGIDGTWVGHNLDEMYLLPNYLADFSEFASQKLVTIDPKFYRPAEVDLLLGDSSLARKELNWSPKTSFKELVKEMVLHDIQELEKNLTHK
jgi:GDPmannose 4,6-dehydratase